MRVDALNHVSQLYQPNKTKGTSKTDAVQKKDAYEISQSAKDYQIAKNAIPDANDVREDRVAELKEAFRSGSYNVSSQEIADKILNKFFDFTI